MSSGHLFSVRGGRLIADSRALFAMFLLAAVVLGAGTESGSGTPEATLLSGYLAYSLLLAASFRSPVLAYRLLRAHLLPTAIDLGVFTALIYMTRGAESPFFSPLVFLILSGTIQWGSRGALAMGALVILAYLPAGVASTLGDVDEAALQATVVRFGYTIVVTTLLMAFGRHLERVVEELSRLSDPVKDASGDREPPMRELLSHTINVFGARKGAIIWNDGDEPYARAMLHDGGAFTLQDLPPTSDDWLVASHLADAPFLFESASGMTITRRGARPSTDGAPLATNVLQAFALNRALVLPVSAEGLRGWVLILDSEGSASEDLAVAAVVSAQLSVSLERWHTQKVRRETAAAELRMRVARDLHDGVLQFLAGAALQLDVLSREPGVGEAAKTRLATLRLALADEQRELRSFISAMRPIRRDRPPARQILNDELVLLAERLARYWSINVSAEIIPAALLVSDQVGYDIASIVREAVANAVRHGHASNVAVTVTLANGLVSIQIDDDGEGFGFHGELTDDELARTKGGPRSLQERVGALGGRLGLSSGPDGASLAIEVPLPETV